MSVHKRSNNGTYFVSYRDADGKQRTKTFGTGREGKRQANKFDEEIKARKKVEAPLPVLVPGAKVYLDQLAQAYINAKKSEGRSVRWLQELATLLKKHFIPVFAQRPVDEIRFEEVIEIIRKEYADRSQTTRSRYLSYLKMVFQYGVDYELTLKNPLKRWKKPKERPRDTKLTVTDLMTIKDVARPHLAWAIEVAWNLGVRTGESELLALTWNDIDWEGSSIKVYATKTKTTRIIPIAPEFMERLKGVREKAQCEHVIEYQGKPMRKFRRSLKTAVEKAGITYPVIMYDIRHLFATVLLREGGDVAAVSKLMGHASVKMTVDQYYHLLGDEKRRTIAKLPSLTRPEDAPHPQAAPSEPQPPASTPA
ncbi:tyrosine-type recombinase/integrase [Desulfovibrio sp. TomC]|uniref:tyrosine-type recombinase/integrase n=1 Tax=Desulfovibrio sp. TomC TaxID=1562888 RepID=UPI0005753DF3|nr:site-specific integrase [Desulfovibrio sp. TomC]KHK01326.1 Integrase [Desulfovibrio sp. TomC]